MDSLQQPQCWILSDGRAGNDRQSQALAEALNLSVRWMPATLRVPWSWVAPRIAAGGLAAVDSEARAALLEQPAPVLIACGRRSALVNRLLKARWGEKVFAIQVLNPRIAPDHFDLLVVPRHDHLSGEHVLSVTGSLHQVGPAWLEQGRQGFPALGQLPEPRTLLLVGGPTRALPIRRAYIDTLISTLRHWHERDGGSLLISSSRRTPGWIVGRLREELQDIPGDRYWASSEDDNPYAGYLAWAQRIVVTPDSANMLTESAATAVPVLAHAPKAPKGRVGELLRELTEQGRVRPLNLRFQDWPCQPFNEMPGLVARVSERVAAQLRSADA